MSSILVIKALLNQAMKSKFITFYICSQKANSQELNPKSHIGISI